MARAAIDALQVISTTRPDEHLHALRTRLIELGYYEATDSKPFRPMAYLTRSVASALSRPRSSNLASQPWSKLRQIAHRANQAIHNHEISHVTTTAISAT